MRVWQICKLKIHVVLISPVHHSRTHVNTFRLLNHLIFNTYTQMYAFQFHLTNRHLLTTLNNWRNSRRTCVSRANVSLGINIILYTSWRTATYIRSTKKLFIDFLATLCLLLPILDLVYFTYYYNKSIVCLIGQWLRNIGDIRSTSV